MTKEEYNKEKVYYCQRCLSLRVVDVPSMEDSDYCEECGSTNIEQCSIEEWEKMYVDKYKHSFLNNTY